MPDISRLTILSVMLFFLVACAGKTASEAVTEPKPVAFEHDITGSALPWTHADFIHDKDEFTFALFSDLTGGEREGVFDVAMEQLRLLRPELIVNVGDLIEGGDPGYEQLNQQWDTFDQRARRARAPVFYVGGNHDLTGVELRQIWDERYGAKYYYFIYKNVLFLVLDTEDSPDEFQRYIEAIRLQAIEIHKSQGEAAFAATPYGQIAERKSGRVSAEQADYFQKVIEQNPQVRWTFVLMHKPAWERQDEENFSRIEAALSERPYTVFYGHLHSYLHEQRHGRDYIRLGTTGGAHAPNDPMAIDHISLVTVSEDGVDIANIRMSGIFDKTGKVPIYANDICLEECANK